MLQLKLTLRSAELVWLLPDAYDLWITQYTRSIETAVNIIQLSVMDVKLLLGIHPWQLYTLLNIYSHILQSSTLPNSAIQ